MFGKHAMQRVAELVEHRVTSSKLNNAGSPGAGFSKLATLKTTGNWPSSFDCSTSVHPCAAVLVVALEIVAIEQSQWLPSASNLEDAHIGLIDRNSFAL